MQIKLPQPFFFQEGKEQSYSYMDSQVIPQM